MTKLKTIYICQNCQFQNTKWIGRCPNCSQWNSFIEDIIDVGKERKEKERGNQTLSPIPITQVMQIEERLKTEIEELDRVLGGGLVEGGLTVLSGEPGMGKSTLSLQMCEAVASKKQKILYISGEESREQVALRATRLKIARENIDIVNETNLEAILNFLNKNKVDMVVIDSIQVMASNELDSPSGSINQVRLCTEKFMQWAKSHRIPLILIGHVTKEGNLAGPKVFEHLVDTILYLEGDRYEQFRLLRSTKNRFGSTNEIGIFEMTETGLKEIKNASEIFLSGRKNAATGSIVTCTLEGTRPFLLEIQALTVTTTFGYPKRMASGFDLNRLQLLIAVLEKHANLNLNNQDVFINIVGGFKVRETACDLAVCLAIISSIKKTTFPNTLCACGEIGLCGELRQISQLEKRLKEAEKLGFNVFIGPETKITKSKSVDGTSSNNLHCISSSDLKGLMGKMQKCSIL
ncbi:DNA repair protein RadA [Candidatus Peregrinibacteria bacterium]|nr:DNA repair protein RadA [Candidatus Peregrinibacteria bacterium]